jgi:hypothetical protein
MALSKPITKYKRNMTSPPRNWLLDPAPVTSVRSKGASTLVAPDQPAGGESGLGMNGAMRFVYRPKAPSKSSQPMLTISIWTWQHLMSSNDQSPPNRVVP